MSGVPLCCCHGINEPCPHGDDTRHRHLCRAESHFGPRRHCPDSGCPGGCWAPDGRTP